MAVRDSATSCIEFLPEQGLGSPGTHRRRLFLLGRKRSVISPNTTRRFFCELVPVRNCGLRGNRDGKGRAAISRRRSRPENLSKSPSLPSRSGAKAATSGSPAGGICANPHGPGALLTLSHLGWRPATCQLSRSARVAGLVLIHCRRCWKEHACRLGSIRAHHPPSSLQGPLRQAHSSSLWTMNRTQRPPCLPTGFTVLAWGPFIPSSSTKATSAPTFKRSKPSCRTLWRWK